MKLKRAQQITDAYEDIEACEPDISTERLLEMTRDRCDLPDVSYVIQALVRTGAFTPVNEEQGE